jgi:ATP/maltotriose-dependent transcriptional regulator MalT
VCVFVLSRGAPPPSLAQLALGRDLQVIGAESMELTRDEVRALARTQGMRRLAPESLRRL